MNCRFGLWISGLKGRIRWKTLGMIFIGHVITSSVLLICNMGKKRRYWWACRWSKERKKGKKHWQGGLCIAGPGSEIKNDWWVFRISKEKCCWEDPSYRISLTHQRDRPPVTVIQPWDDIPQTTGCRMNLADHGVQDTQAKDGNIGNHAGDQFGEIYLILPQIVFI